MHGAYLLMLVSVVYYAAINLQSVSDLLLHHVTIYITNEVCVVVCNNTSFPVPM